MFYEANERPRHATATVAIRSKPIAPGVGYHSYYYAQECISVCGAEQLLLCGEKVFGTSFDTQMHPFVAHGSDYPRRLHYNP
jgi:hypothetical protein